MTATQPQPASVPESKPRADYTAGDVCPETIVDDLLSHLEFDRARYDDLDELDTASLEIDVTGCDAWVIRALQDVDWHREVYTTLEADGTIAMQQQHEIGCTIHDIALDFGMPRCVAGHTLITVDVQEV